MTDRQKIHSLAPSTKPSAFEVEKTIEKSKRYKSEGTGSNSSRIYSCRRWNTHTHTHTYIYIYIYIYIISIENEAELPQQGKESLVVCKFKKDGKN